LARGTEAATTTSTIKVNLPERPTHFADQQTDDAFRQFTTGITVLHNAHPELVDDPTTDNDGFDRLVKDTIKLAS
jgi:hypothetical protein